MADALVDTSTIPGWGVDADTKNDPTYPMRHIDQTEPRGLSWQRPAQQEPGVEILTSIEHNRLPAALGISTPPSGLSGAIRRYAFRRSESDWWHWLLLMSADRINVVEGVISDLAHSKPPNVPAEMGARAEWRHKKNGFFIKAGATLAVGALVFGAVKGRRRPADPLPLKADEDGSALVERGAAERAS